MGEIKWFWKAPFVSLKFNFLFQDFLKIWNPWNELWKVLKFNLVVFHFLISFFPASRYTDRLIRALLASCTREPEVGSCRQCAWRHDGTKAFQTLSLAYLVITPKTQNYISKEDTLFPSCHCICANNTFKT